MDSLVNVLRKVSLAQCRYSGLAVSILLLCSLAACARPNEDQQIATEPSSTQIRPTIAYAVTPMFDSATRLPSQTLPSLSATRIRTPDESDRGEVMAAFWIQDESIIYYALADGTPDQLVWFEVQLMDGQSIQERQLASPPAIMYAPNFPGGNYGEYQGLVSPSKRYRFEITKAENDSLYLVDDRERSRLELLKTPDLNFRGAYWTPDEDEVVFGIGPEYGTYFYLYDTQERKLSSFEDLIGFADPNISEWALSPNGKYVAILDGNQSLKLFSLDRSFSITVPEYLNNVRWAGNSQRIFYYSGTQFYTPTKLAYYDLSRKTSVDLMQLSELEKLGVNTDSFFDVSPNGKQLVFWQAGNIWLVSFE